jgi:hypothetical protein
MSDIKLDDGLVTIEGDTNFLTAHGGNSHFGFGANGDAYVSFGSKGGLSIRTFDGKLYLEKFHVSGKGQVDLLTGSGGSTHFGYGANGDAYVSFGSGGSLSIRTFDGSSYNEKVHVDNNGNVTINGHLNLHTHSGGSTHFGYGQSGDAYLSFGVGGRLSIRTYNGSIYREKVHVDSNGNVIIKNQAGQETVHLNGETGSMNLPGTLTVGTGAAALNVGAALSQAQTRIQTLETKLAALEARITALEAP